MADHSKPTITGTTYANYTAEWHSRVTDAMNLDPSTTTSTNIPTNTRAWDDTSKKWRKWTGSTWVDLIVDIVVTGFMKAQTGLYAGVNLANQLAVTGSATGFGTRVEAQGTDTDVSIIYKTKNNGQHGFWTNGAPQMVVGGPTSAVNYLSVYGSAAANDLSVFAAGSDTNISISNTAKGTGIHKFYAGGSLQFTVTGNASSPSWLNVGGTVSGARVYLEAKGSPAVVDLNLVTKGGGAILGNGSVQLSNGTADTPEFMAYDNLNGSYGYMDMSGELLRWVTSYRSGVSVVRWGIDAQTGAWSLAGNKGTSGQVLTSQGPSAAPVWSSVPLSQVKNKITNGNFAVHYLTDASPIVVTSGQTSTYELNRWAVTSSGGTLNVDRVKYGTSGSYGATSWALVMNMTSGGASCGVTLRQRIRAEDVADLVGKTLTLQAKIFKTSSSGGCTWELRCPATTENDFTSTNFLATGNFTVSGAEALYNAQISISDNVRKGLELTITIGFPAFTVGVDTIVISEIQLAVASAASPFESRHVALEHLLCEQYAPVWGCPATSSGIIGSGFYNSATTGLMFLPHRVRTCKIPSGLKVVNPAQLLLYEGSTSVTTSGGAVTFFSGGVDGITVNLSGLTGRTIARPFFASNTTNTMIMIGLGCEP